MPQPGLMAEVKCIQNKLENIYSYRDIIVYKIFVVHVTNTVCIIVWSSY